MHKDVSDMKTFKPIIALFHCSMCGSNVTRKAVMHQQKAKGKGEEEYLQWTTGMTNLGF